MKLYVYISKRLDLKRFEIFKNVPSNCRPQFSDFFSKISAILLSTDSHIKCIVCICVSLLYICLTSETLHYPWIPSLIKRSKDDSTSTMVSKECLVNLLKRLGTDHRQDFVKRFSTAINKKICKNFFVRELFYKGARPMPKLHHTCFSSSAGVSPTELYYSLEERLLYLLQ